MDSSSSPKAIPQVSTSISPNSTDLTNFVLGYGFHGDFLNGWNMTVQKAATSQCANSDGNGIASCEPFQASHDPNYGLNCPERPSIIDEPVNGLVSKLPGCINITPGPEKAKASDMTCSVNSTAPTITQASNYTGPMTVFKPTPGTVVDGWQYLGCANEIHNARALSGGAYANDTTMSNAVCQAFCATKNLPLAGTEYGKEYVFPFLSLFIFLQRRSCKYWLTQLQMLLRYHPQCRLSPQR